MAGKKPDAPRRRGVRPPDVSGDAPGGKRDEVFPEGKYYDLKTRAVDDLVTADASNSPPVPMAELKRYRSGPHVTLADWLKALLIKMWFAGMICYFFVWGLSTFTLNQWDHIAIIGVSLGTVTNLITNNVYRFLASAPGAYDRWMMVTSKKIWYLPLDIVYALALVVCVLMTDNTLNVFFASVGAEGAVLGVEPILFAVFATAWDLLFLGVKHTLKKIVSDAQKRVRGL